MDLRNREQQIDPDILASSDVILDEILGQLDIPWHAAPSGTGECFERAIDLEIAGLKGDVFDGLPAREIPLEAFHIDEPGEPAPVPWVRADSFAPTSPPSTPPEPERGGSRRWAPWVLGYAAAAGIVGAGAAGALIRTRHATQPAAAQALAAPAPVLAAFVRDAVPAAEPPTPTPAAVPGSAPGPAATVPPAAVAARAIAPPRSPEPVRAGARAAAGNADLPLFLPPPPPKPEVSFDRAAAAVAIAGGGMRAASCRAPGAGSTAVPVRVTFAPSGSAISARVTGGPLLGTTEGGCVAAALRGARVPAFDGEPVAVSTALHLR